MNQIKTFLSNRIVRITAIGVLTMSFVFVADRPIPAHASTMTVDTSADENTNDGHCSLREAIRSAINHVGVDTCTVGVGNDLIVFSVSSVNVNSPLPAVTSGNTLAIYGGSGKITLNAALSSGSAFTVNAGGTLTVQNVNFQSNGLCYHSAGSLSLINEQMCLVEATAGQVNLQTVTGGLVDTHTGPATLDVAGSTFTGAAPFTFWLGTSGATITRSIFNGAGGGSSIASIGALSITRSLFLGSLQSAITVSGGTSHLTNVIVTNKTGVGIESNGSAEVVLTNSTIVGNANGVASSNGGLIHLRNTILSNTTADCTPNTTPMIVDDGGNMKSTSACPTTIFTGNPNLNFLYFPQSGSHAIDGGLNKWCASFDYYGTARPIDGNGDGIAICDIGATEVK